MKILAEYELKCSTPNCKGSALRYYNSMQGLRIGSLAPQSIDYPEEDRCPLCQLRSMRIVKVPDLVQEDQVTGWVTVPTT